jgi:hypothetical protein
MTSYSGRPLCLSLSPMNTLRSMPSAGIFIDQPHVSCSVFIRVSSVLIRVDPC